MGSRNSATTTRSSMQRPAPSRGCGCPVQDGRAAHVAGRRPVDADHSPQGLVRLLRFLPSRRQHAHFVALADLAPRKFDCLGDMSLEVEPERAPIGESGDLALQVPGELRLLVAKLAQQVIQPRHGPLTRVCQPYKVGHRAQRACRSDIRALCNSPSTCRDYIHPSPG